MKYLLNKKELEDLKNGKRPNPQRQKSIPGLSKTRKSLKRRKHQLVLAMGGGCCICGYNRCERALDFHHMDATTKNFSICQYLWLPLGELLEEVRKCVLICSNCHREHHEGLISDETLKEKMKPDLDVSLFEETKRNGCAYCSVNYATFQSPYCSKKCRMFDIYGEFDNWKTLDLLKLAESGITTKQMGKDFNVKRSDVSNLMKELKIATGLPIDSKPKYPEPQLLLELLTQFPCHILSKQIGVSDTALRKYLKRTVGYFPKLRWGFRSSDDAQLAEEKLKKYF